MWYIVKTEYAAAYMEAPSEQAAIEKCKAWIGAGRQVIKMPNVTHQCEKPSNQLK